MKNIYSGIGYVLILIIVISLAVWWGKYKYNDCLKVGHSKTYCILDLGK